MPSSPYVTWAGSPWSTTTVNLGPQTVTLPHRDIGNLSYGLCSVTPMGKFDHTTGGHLVLDELKVIMELRPGDLVLFPSALITHWNTPIQSGETRQSVVFWTCGNAIRYYDRGQHSMKELSHDEAKKQQVDDQGKWEKGKEKFLTLAQLEQFHNIGHKSTI
ncbi:hypothetical protein CPB86DRAFT_719825 [Serendipita vermifera]|nr:hypothetical protein CPB86DRAFT_719825 [Serendipita vermifera]